MKHLLLAFVALLMAPVAHPQAAQSSPEYSIAAIRYATRLQYPVAALLMGAPLDEKLDVPMVICLLRGAGPTRPAHSGARPENGPTPSRLTNAHRPHQPAPQ